MVCVRVIKGAKPSYGVGAPRQASGLTLCVSEVFVGVHFDIFVVSYSIWIFQSIDFFGFNTCVVFYWSVFIL